MTEKPILFNGEMVRAILDGRKSQTRRVIKPQPWRSIHFQGWEWGKKAMTASAWLDAVQNPAILVQHAPYQVSDRLWVRESIRIDSDCSAILYAADKARVFRGKYQVQYAYYPQDWPWKHSVLPSIFMPKWATRIWLEVTGVRAEQVQDISEADAEAEGVTPILRDGGGFEPWGAPCPPFPCYAEVFARLWDSINAKRGYPFADNSWVWVYTFKREGE